jgi:hypothetical protein
MKKFRLLVQIVAAVGITLTAVRAVSFALDQVGAGQRQISAEEQQISAEEGWRNDIQAQINQRYRSEVATDCLLKLIFGSEAASALGEPEDYLDRLDKSSCGQEISFDDYLRSPRYEDLDSVMRQCVELDLVKRLFLFEHAIFGPDGAMQSSSRYRPRYPSLTSAQLSEEGDAAFTKCRTLHPPFSSLPPIYIAPNECDGSDSCMGYPDGSPYGSQGNGNDFDGGFDPYWNGREMVNCPQDVWGDGEQSC